MPVIGPWQLYVFNWHVAFLNHSSFVYITLLINIHSYARLFTDMRDVRSCCAYQHLSDATKAGFLLYTQLWYPPQAYMCLNTLESTYAVTLLSAVIFCWCTFALCMPSMLILTALHVVHDHLCCETPSPLPPPDVSPSSSTDAGAQTTLMMGN